MIHRSREAMLYVGQKHFHPPAGMRLGPNHRPEISSSGMTPTISAPMFPAGAVFHGGMQHILTGVPSPSSNQVLAPFAYLAPTLYAQDSVYACVDDYVVQSSVPMPDDG